MSEYVDRDELRRKLSALSLLSMASSWGRGWRTGVRDALYCIDNMPPLEVSRGWSRDELLAAIDAGSTVERLGGFGNWYTPPRSFIWAWPDDVVAYDVRVAAPVPKTEDVPLTKLVGRTLVGETEPVACPPVWSEATVCWRVRSGDYWHPIPDGLMNIDTGLVTVLAEGEA